MPDGDGTLMSALSELAVLGTERDRAQPTALRDRLAVPPDLVTERGKRYWPNEKVRPGTRGPLDQAAALS